MTMFDKDGLRCYLNEFNKIEKVSIYKYTDAEKSILEQNQNDIKKIDYGSPDCYVDFAMLTNMKNLESLQIDDRYKVFDVSAVNELKNLKGFGAGKFTGSLNLKNLVGLAYKWHKKSDISKCTNVEGIGIFNCAEMELFMSQLKELKKLRRMIFWRISSPNFPKAATETSVINLEFIYGSKLVNLEELPSNFPNVTHLKFDHCKNIQDYSPLKKLHDLQELVILESAPITDLSFLKELKNLSLLKVGKTKITAKNVEVLDEIPAETDLLFTGLK